MGRRSTKSSPATGAALPFDTVGVTILPGVSLPEWAEPPAESLMASGPELIADAGPMSHRTWLSRRPLRRRPLLSGQRHRTRRRSRPRAPHLHPSTRRSPPSPWRVRRWWAPELSAPSRRRPRTGSSPPRMARLPPGTVRRHRVWSAGSDFHPSRSGVHARTLTLPGCADARVGRTRGCSVFGHVCSRHARRSAGAPAPFRGRDAVAQRDPSTRCLPAPPTWLLTVHRPQQPATDRRSRQAAIPLRTPAWHPHRLDPARRRPRTPRQRRRWTRSPSHPVRPSAPRSVSR